MKYFHSLIFIIAGFLFLIASFPVQALTHQQKEILDKAQFYGQMVGAPETIQAIVLQESSAGNAGRIGDDGNSIGIMQMRPSTAAWVSSKYSWLPQYKTEFEYAQALLNDNYALLVGALYFKECSKVYHNWRQAVVCYNTGIRGASKMKSSKINSHKYLTNIKRRLKYVRKYRS